MIIINSFKTTDTGFKIPSDGIVFGNRINSALSFQSNCTCRTGIALNIKISRGINHIVSDNVINATTNFNVKGYTSSACAIALEGKGTVDSIAENNTIAGNFEAGISGFKTVNNNHLD